MPARFPCGNLYKLSSGVRASSFPMLTSATFAASTPSRVIAEGSAIGLRFHPSAQANIHDDGGPWSLGFRLVPWRLTPSTHILPQRLDAVLVPHRARLHRHCGRVQ